jgi:hypothetical protein
MSEFDAIVDQVVVGGASGAVGGYDDWVDLCGVTSAVQEKLGVSGEALLQTTLAVVNEILTTGLMTVGVLSSDMTSFIPWQSAVPEALARIEREWRALGRDPNLWEICWFANTAAGNERARRSELISQQPNDTRNDS